MKYDKPLSNLAFNFNLRRCIMEAQIATHVAEQEAAKADAAALAAGRPVGR